jgi:hypothetical protein
MIDNSGKLLLKIRINGYLSEYQESIKFLHEIDLIERYLEGNKIQFD